MEKSGLTDLFNISLGEDLQEDIHQYDKAAILLGHLMQSIENYNENMDESLKNIGISNLKKQIK